MNGRAAVTCLYLWQPHIRVTCVATWQPHDWIWIRYCELCAMAGGSLAWRHFRLGGQEQLEFDSWEAAMLSARDHLAAHRRALPAQIGES